MAITVALTLLASGFAVLLLRQNGRILIRLDALERELVLARIRQNTPPVEPTADPLAPAEEQSPEDSLAKTRLTRSGLHAGTVATGIFVKVSAHPGVKLLILG